jgi:putative DNA-binding response regulator
MGFFGGNEKKEFVSNGKLFEYISACGDSKKLEDELEKRYLYRNIEDIQYLPPANAVVKYKDLKVRSQMEVEQIRKELRREAGLE